MLPQVSRTSLQAATAELAADPGRGKPTVWEPHAPTILS